MTQKELKDHIFVGVVEDNNDPDKLGRCKCKVLNVFDDIPVEDLPWATPWKDLNGNQFILPEKGKVVSVVFDEGNIYKPEYIFAEHYNVNLENKLKMLNGEDYTSMRAIMFDDATQIYRTKTDGLIIDHEYSNINFDQFGNIQVNIRDPNSVITLGSKDASEDAILGTTFMEWFDEFMDNLAGAQFGPYLSNLMAPVIPTPTFINCILKYKSLRSKFLSDHVRISANDSIINQTRGYTAKEGEVFMRSNQKGDGWRSSTTPNTTTTVESPSYQPSSTHQPVTNVSPEINQAAIKPSEIGVQTSYDIPTASLDRTKYVNGKIPIDDLSPSKWLTGKQKGKWIVSQLGDTPSARLMSSAAKSFDALFDLYESTDFPGKVQLILVDGYRDYDNQVKVRAYWTSKGTPDFAARPGTSNHGWGIAVDISLTGGGSGGIHRSLSDRVSCFRMPTYQWLFKNAVKFGIYNPISLRNGWSQVNEWWHWEFQGNQGQPSAQYAEYGKPFSRADVEKLRKYGIKVPTDAQLESYFKSINA